MDDFSKYLLKDLEREMRNAKNLSKFKDKNIIEKIELMEDIISELSQVLKKIKEEING